MMSLSTHETYSLARVAPQASPGQSGGSLRNPNRGSAIDSKYALDARAVSRLSFNYGPANQGSGPPERARAGTGRLLEEHGALLRPIGRADFIRRIVAGAPLGPDRRRRAPTNRPSCFPAARAASAQHMARTQAALRLPTPRVIAVDDRGRIATLVEWRSHGPKDMRVPD